MANLFDTLRASGKLAASFSNQWLVDPFRQMDAFTTQSLQAETRGRIDLVPVEERQAYAQTAIAAARWAVSGYPTVTMGHRTAAALMASVIRAEDAADFVVCPWPGFVIRIPAGLLFVEHEGKLHDATIISVTCVPKSQVYGDHDRRAPSDRWFYKLHSELAVPRPLWRDGQKHYLQGIGLWAFNIETKELATPDCGASADPRFEHWNQYEKTDTDERSDRLARILVLGICLLLGGDEKQREANARSNGFSVTERLSKTRPDELPPYREIELRSDTKLDLHHVIRDFVVNGGSAPIFRRLVSPHWQRLVDGAQRQLVARMQYIEAYLRSDLDN